MQIDDVPRDGVQMDGATTGTSMIEPRSTASDIVLLAVIFMFGLLMSFVFTVVTPILPALAAHLGNANNGTMVAQLVVTVPMIGLLLGGPIGGGLSERWGTRPVLLICLAIFGVMGSAGLYVVNVPLLLATRLVLGFSAAAGTTASLTLLSQCYDGQKRARLLGYQAAFAAGGAVVSTLIAGAVAEAFNWRAPFALYLFAFVVLVAAIVVVPAVKRVHPVQKTSGGNAGLLALWPIYATLIPLAAAMFTATVQLPFLLREDGLQGVRSAASMIAIAQFTFAVGSALFGTISTRFGKHAPLFVLLALMGVGNLLMGLLLDAHLAALACGLAGFGNGMIIPYINTLVAERTSEELRGRALGFVFTAQFVGSFLNPILMAPLIRALGLHGALSALGGTLLLTSIGVVIRRRAVAAV